MNPRRSRLMNLLLTCSNGYGFYLGTTVSLIGKGCNHGASVGNADCFLGV